MTTITRRISEKRQGVVDIRLNAYAHDYNNDTNFRKKTGGSGHKT